MHILVSVSQQLAIVMFNLKRLSRAISSNEGRFITDSNATGESRMTDWTKSLHGLRGNPARFSGFKRQAGHGLIQLFCFC
jgi:hypothetical protein